MVFPKQKQPRNENQKKKTYKKTTRSSKPETRNSRCANVCFLGVDPKMRPGDYAELGVWRGGTGIFARAILDSMELLG